jgi:putative transposase
MNRPAGESETNLSLMKRLEELYIERPFYGVRKLSVMLGANPKRVRRLKNKMGLKTLYPKKKWRGMTKAERPKYPYLLKNLEIDEPDRVWTTDITYLRVNGRNYYLTAVMDWHSRYVLSWELSKTMEGEFCRTALGNALETGKPEIFNTDQGVQFTSGSFVSMLTNRNIRVSMDGKGRCFDNIVMERFWRTVKYEEVFLKEYDSFEDLRKGIERFIDFYNWERIHQGLGYRTPAEVYFDRRDDTKGQPFDHLKSA